MFEYKISNRISFYCQYLYRKFFLIWLEVKKPKLRLFLLEFFYVLSKFIHYFDKICLSFDINLVETKFGCFHIRPSNYLDAIIASPSYERPDIDYLLRLIRSLIKNGKKILFLDIGAAFGVYSIATGNEFKRFKNISILAFEPEKSCFYLLKENIKENILNNKIKAYNIALGDKNDRTVTLYSNIPISVSSDIKSKNIHRLRTQKINITAKTLDSIIPVDFKSYDTIVIKMDVEGFETNILKGANNLFSSDKEIFLLVEDFVDSKVVHYLEKIKASFITKLTPYNSWWFFKRSGGNNS